MAGKKRAPETFDDLLAVALTAGGEGLTEWCKARKLNPRTVYRWRRGEGHEPHLGTLALVAAALKVDVARVRDAVEATRAAAAKK